MNNNEFLNVLKLSYLEYLRTGSRSNAKLVILHGKIAEDLQIRLGDNYRVNALGYNNGKETSIHGRYMNKKVDIAVSKNGRELGGIAVKFVMTNYTQNSNNYFENMLGETANIRCDNKKHFHVLVLPKKLPYFGQTIDEQELKDVITKIETISVHNIDKYTKLSNDNTDRYLHSPNKTLLYIINSTDREFTLFQKRDEWAQFMLTDGVTNVTLNNDDVGAFGDTIIKNDYEDFITKVMHEFLAM